MRELPDPFADVIPDLFADETNQPYRLVSQPAGKGLQHAKAWTIALAGCRDVPFAAKTLGAVIREHFNTKAGTVYIGSPRLAELTGWHERDVKARRSKLRDAGWLTDTGERKGRATVWKLTIPTESPTAEAVPDSDPFQGPDDPPY